MSLGIGIGIIGLPGSGRTTIFNALTRGNADTSGLGGTGQAHIGMAKVPDARLTVLTRMFNPKKTIPAEIKYLDIGASVKSLAWVSSQSLALHPAWTFFHVLVLSWGLVLLAYARQPVWADNLGRNIWGRVQHMARIPGGMIMTGMLWAFMPCGLLYSALLVASLSANPLNGAISMATFAIGTSVSLLVGPWLWLKLQHGGKWINESRSMRLAGLILSAAAAWAIWMDLAHQVKVWCN
jgi:sulfite exporter TauE/SafE